MTGRAGERKGNEIWLRCPFCGDSQKDANKAHYSINTEGKYHCLRCGVGGRLALRDYLKYVYTDHSDLISDVQDTVDWEDILDELIPGPAYSRRSALDRFHVANVGRNYDVFLSRDTEGDIVGLCLADLSNRRKLVVGRKAFGWTGRHLTSSRKAPLRLVEGPYDVLSERDVCTYGIPAPRQLRALQGHYVIICPDGDVWPDITKRRTVLKLLDVPGPTVLGYERLADHQDPDEVPYDQRPFIPAKEIPKTWRAKGRLRSQVSSQLKNNW